MGARNEENDKKIIEQLTKNNDINKVNIKGKI
jgi:hypothetical protein